jgi:hypothetical protein
MKPLEQRKPLLHQQTSEQIPNKGLKPLEQMKPLEQQKPYQQERKSLYNILPFPSQKSP